MQRDGLLLLYKSLKVCLIKGIVLIIITKMDIDIDKSMIKITKTTIKMIIMIEY